MKLNLQTKTEKRNLLGLLLCFNFLGGSLQFLLLSIQFFYAPQYYAITWAFLVLISTLLAYFNLRYIRSNYQLKHLWQWLKNHQ